MKMTENSKVSYAEFHNVLSNHHKLMYGLPITIIAFCGFIWMLVNFKTGSSNDLDKTLGMLLVTTLPLFLYFVPKVNEILKVLVIGSLVSIAHFFFLKSIGEMETFNTVLMFSWFMCLSFLIYRIQQNMNLKTYFYLLKEYGFKVAVNIFSNNLSKYVVEKEVSKGIDFVKFEIDCGKNVTNDFKNKVVQEMPKMFFEQYLMYAENKKLIIFVPTKSFSNILSRSVLQTVFQENHLDNLMKEAISCYFKTDYEECKIKQNMFYEYAVSKIREVELLSQMNMEKVVEKRQKTKI